MTRPSSTEFLDLEKALEERRLQVEAALARLAPSGRASAVEAAIGTSLFAPAKMVHTASLILDDLPSMDDARTRRGRPTCHVVHGEATAILAAFALMNRAFEILAQGWDGGPEPVLRTRIARDLAQAVGLDGMIAGQSADLEMTDRTIDFSTLEFIHSRKTGALFMASAALGAVAARAPAADIAAVVAYAKNLGLAFQIVDDLIDVVGGSEAGKDVGQDLKKTTFVSFSGVEGARSLAEELIAASVAALEPFGRRARPLRDLARYVVSRRR
jgi:geranylgeranyl pyrophosphate synthase